MGALANAKQLSRQEVLKKIKDADIWNYGVNHNNLYEQLMGLIDEPCEEIGFIAALDNADTNQTLLKVLNSDCEKVLEGMAIIGYIIDAKQLKLCLPEKKSDMVPEIAQLTKEYEIEVVAEFVNVRANKKNLLLHMMTMLDICDLFNDEYQRGVYLILDGHIKKMSLDTKVRDVLNIPDAKALLLGYRYHVPEDAELTLEEAKIENGIVRALNQEECVVAVTEKQLTESMAQSCGKCVFCREGLIQLHYMQKEIIEGRGKKEYTDLNREIGKAMAFSTLCSMGQVSAEISLTAMDNFGAEYESHVKKKICPSGVCISFASIYIDPYECTGCEECIDVCPADCIEGKAKFIHMIDDFDCIKCGKCIETCRENAIHETTGKVPKLPNRLTKVGRFKRR